MGQKKSLTPVGDLKSDSIALPTGKNSCDVLVYAIFFAYKNLFYKNTRLKKA